MDKSAFVIADRGHVEIHGAGSPILLAPGKSIQLEAGMPQAGGGGQVAGKVAVALPKEVVQHQGKGAETNLNQNDNVLWGDNVTTQATGRVRIALNDGSVLNIGARSTMLIKQHNADTQQTDVELTLGHMRGEVVKLTKSGARFETQTPTAVIGVVGTIFTVDVPSATLTNVFSVQGDVTVANINPGVVGTVTLHAGQFTSVHFGLPPGAPTAASASQMQSQLRNTDAGPRSPALTGAGQGQGGAAGAGQVGAAGGAAATGGTGIVNLAAAGVAAGVGGVVIHQETSVHNNIQTADTSLVAAAAADSQAATSANNASTAASQAASATSQANTISQTTATTINNGLTGCGCVSPAGP